MKSFKQYVKEFEELEIIKAESDKKQKLTDFIRSIEDLNDESFRSFAIDELGMNDEEAGTIVYKMLRDYLLKDDAGVDSVDDIDVSDIDVVDDIEDVEDEDIDEYGEDEDMY